MGSSSSKAAPKAATLSAVKTTRKYPTRSPPPVTSSRATNSHPSKPRPNSTPAGPIVHPVPRAASSKDYGIERDAEDPTLNPGLHARLQKLGPVSTSSPPPFSSSSSPTPHASRHEPFRPSPSTPVQTIFPQTTHPAISLLTARYRLAEEAEKEFANTGKRGVEGRRFLDVGTIRRVLEMRENGVRGVEIEERLDLARGVVDALGKKGVIGVGE